MSAPQNDLEKPPSSSSVWQAGHNISKGIGVVSTSGALGPGSGLTVTVHTLNSCLILDIVYTRVSAEHSVCLATLDSPLLLRR